MTTRVIKIYANWCGPCKRYAQAFAEFKNEAPDIHTIEVNVDEDKWHTAKLFGIKAIPATVIIKDDNTYEVLMGAQTKETLKEKTNGIL